MKVGKFSLEFQKTFGLKKIVWEIISTEIILNIMVITGYIPGLSM